MTRLAYGIVIMVALAMVANIPNVTLAQNSQPAQGQTGPTGRQAPQPKGGVATVIGVDQPDNCLRIRSGPGSGYDVIGCANMGDQLNITGVWTSNDWAQLADDGWVYGPQIQTDLRPPQTAYTEPQNYIALEEGYPEDYTVYDDAYLPDYGYETFSYGGVPVFLYDINVWRRHHPRWWHKHGDRDGHRVWNQHRDFNRNVRTGTQKNFVPNRANTSSPKVTHFNSSGVRSGRTFTPSNTFHSGNPGTRTRTFTPSNTFRTGNLGARTFSRAHSGAFSGMRSTGGARMGGTAHVSGGGAHFAGGGHNRR